MTSSQQKSANTAAAGLSVFADLRMETDGQKVHLVGDGRSLVLHASHPRELLWAARTTPRPVEVSAVNGRRALATFAAGLRQLGIGLDVRGPDGLLLQVGADAHPGAAGRFVTGSPDVALGRPGDLLTAAVVGLPVRRAAAALLGVAATAAVLVLRRRRQH